MDLIAGGFALDTRALIGLAYIVGERQEDSLLIQNDRRALIHVMQNLVESPQGVGRSEESRTLVILE
jgi:hypothetical protein